MRQKWAACFAFIAMLLLSAGLASADDSKSEPFPDNRVKDLETKPAPNPPGGIGGFPRPDDDDQNQREEVRRRMSEAFTIFRQLDTNRDGKLTLEEAPEKQKELVKGVLKRFGRAEGESLTLREFIEDQANPNPPARFQPAGPANPFQPGANPPFGRRMPAVIRVLDADGDGKLSKEELAKAAESFDKLDTNRDGQLDSRELTTSSPPRGGFGGPAPNLPAAGRFVDRIFERYDVDKDGVVKIKELPETLRERYREWDADKNDELSKEEFTKSIEDTLERSRLRRRTDAPDSPRPERPDSDD